MKCYIRCCTALVLFALRAQAQHYLDGMAAFYDGDFSKAFREWQQLAITGEADSEYEIGNLYLKGLGVAKNCTEAVKWTRRAADQSQSMAEVSLGDMLSSGECLRKDYSEAMQWYRRAVSRNELDGAAGLGDAYYYGRGVPVDYSEAARWYARAANADVSQLDDCRQSRIHSLTRLAWMYKRGNGVPLDSGEAARLYSSAVNEWDNRTWYFDTHAAQLLYSGYVAFSGRGEPEDYVRAHMWFNLAALAEDELVASTGRDLRDGLADWMTKEQVEEAQNLAREWQITAPPRTAKDATDDNQRLEKGGPAQTGTGFVVNREGYAVTNDHVIDGCRTITTETNKESREANIVAVDPENDLALIRIARTGTLLRAASFRGEKPVRPGHMVVVVGYPFYGLLSSNASITVGNVSAVAGINDDSRYLQFTAPVQPGNSGGPLLDDRGNVIGIVEGQLDALGIAKNTGDIPQNVNFAIKADVIRTFLDANSVHYAVAPAAQSGKLDAADIGERSRRFTVLVECLK